MIVIGVTLSMLYENALEQQQARRKLPL